VQHCARQHTVEKYAAWLRDGHSALWVAEDGQGAAPVGYLLLAKPDLPLSDLGPDDLELKRIYLLGRYQGSGVGGRLLQTAVEHARGLGTRRLFLGVYAGNERAQAFYRKSGFVPVGRRSFNVGGTLYDDVIFGRTFDA
jgi:ribosomal protein S18 acetylase RimI-like enzyme